MTLKKIAILIVATMAAACAESELSPFNAETADGGVLDGSNGTNSSTGDASVSNVANGDAGNVNNSMNPMDAGGGGVGDSGTEDSGTDSGTDMGADGGTMVDPCDSVVTAPGWQAVGGPISAIAGDTDSIFADIAIDGSCQPVVAFHEAQPGDEENIYVYRWDGTTWRRLGGAIDATNQDNRWTTGVRIATSGDEIFILWAEIRVDGAVSVFAARWSGSQWDILGDTRATGLLSFDMSLVIDDQGRPVAAWNARDGFNMPTQIRVARWEDPNWVMLGAPLKFDPAIPNAAALAPDLVIDANGDIVVAWSELQNIHTRRWNGSSWQMVTGGPIDAVPGSTPANEANVALSPTGDLVYGWREFDGSSGIYVQAWDGTNLNVVINALDAEPDTSGSTNPQNLDMEVDSLGRTTVVFSESQPSGGPDRIHVFRQAGGSVARLGAGILDVNEGDTSSNWPEMTIDSADRVYVTFAEDDAAGVSHIHVWRFTD